MKSYVNCICELVNRSSGFDIVVKIRAPYSAGKVLSAPHGLCTAAVCHWYSVTWLWAVVDALLSGFLLCYIVAFILSH